MDQQQTTFAASDNEEETLIFVRVEGPYGLLTLVRKIKVHVISKIQHNYHVTFHYMSSKLFVIVSL